MKITRDNYESWFLDYLEGNLEEGMKEAFQEFLRHHPDLQEELRQFEEVRLPVPEVGFSGIEKLFREEYDRPDAFDEAAIARMEGDLSPEEAVAFETYLRRHPGKREEAAFFEKTRLLPEETVVFPGRSRLMRQPAVVRLRQWTLRVAALLLVALLTWTLADRPPVIPGNEGEYAGSPSNGMEADQPLSNRSASSGEIHSGITRPDPAEQTPLAHTRTAPSPATAETLPSPVTRTAVNQATAMATRTLNTATSRITKNTETLTERIPDPEIPSLLASLQATLTTPETVTLGSLFPGDHHTGELPSPGEESVPFSERILEKTGLADLSVSRVTRWGLRMAAGLTGDKFHYDTNPAGEIIALNLETRLLGLSIPVGK